MLTPEKQTALAWVSDHEDLLSEAHQTIWRNAEPAWREYKSAAWYVGFLRAAGFTVEAGSAGMPTAFVATYGIGRPIVATYAEYDAVPASSQDAVPYERPRSGLHRWAAGHTDPHSALGVGALGGVLAAKAAMDRHGLGGTLRFFGEPAEKVCGSKPVHAAHAYYDELDAVISFHPAYFPLLSNTCVWDTHCGSYWSVIFNFECVEPESWGAGVSEKSDSWHSVARAPGAVDAVCLMYTTTKYTKEAMLPHTGTWTLNEAILRAGEATADNLPPRLSQIQYAWRAPTLAMQERILGVLENNARHVAAITHCRMSMSWVTKTRVGLPNHVLSEIAYRNLELGGAPTYDAEAHRFASELLGNLGFAAMVDPFWPECTRLIRPEVAEAELRDALPPWQKHFTSDDYTEYTWHAPTARLYVGRAMLRAPQPGYRYPEWVWNAIGGVPACINPTIFAAARCIGMTMVELLAEPAGLARAAAEFRARTGGGVGGTSWVAPLLPRDFRAPVDFPWPEYVSTARGDEWCIPTPR